jgi:hypothetical protein
VMHTQKLAHDLPQGFPIVRTMSFKSLRLPIASASACWLVCFGSLAFLFVAMADDRWSTCKIRGIATQGSECHARYLMLPIVFALLGSIFSALTLWIYKKITRSRATGVPSLIITSDSFWCDRLVKPILFSDVIQVYARHGRDRYPLPVTRLYDIVFLLKADPELKAGSPITVHCWQGDVPAFSFSGMGYDDGPVLVRNLYSIIEAAGIEIIRQ